jgi:hypothetical protein
MPPINKADGLMTSQLTIPADVVSAGGFAIARRLEAHAQAARGALADLASDSRQATIACGPSLGRVRYAPGDILDLLNLTTGQPTALDIPTQLSQPSVIRQ